jgi:hypothetical protein
MSQAIKVVAIAVGFYESLRQPGEKFTIKSEEELGNWMVEEDEQDEILNSPTFNVNQAPLKAPGPPANFASPPQPVTTEGRYRVKHNGGGDQIVIDTWQNDEQVGERFEYDKNDRPKAKAEAQAEADRLNGGQGLAGDGLVPVAADGDEPDDEEEQDDLLDDDQDDDQSKRSDLPDA